jgi:HEAT repeat protein
VIVEIMRGYDVSKNDAYGLGTAALHALQKIGPSGIPILMDELTEGTRNGRRFALSMFQFLKIPKPAIPILIASVKDDDAFVRRTALTALHTSGLQNIKNVIETLLDAIQDDDLQVRELAINALQSVGPDAKKAVPILITQLKEGPPENLSLIVATVATLGKIGPDAKEAIPVLTDLLKTENTLVRKTVTNALNRIKK